MNKQNIYWPRVEVNKDKNESRSKAYDILNMIHEPLLETLEIWYEKTGEGKPFTKEEALDIVKNYLKNKR